MIDKSLSSKVLTIGPSPKSRGGIAQVLASYYASVYPSAKYLVETAGGSKFATTSQAVKCAIGLAAKLLTDKSIRIVHIHTASNISFVRSSVFVRIAKALGRHVVLHMHGGLFRNYYERKPEFVKKITAKCDVIVALGEKWRKFYTEILPGCHVEVVPNIMDEPRRVETADDGKVHGIFLGKIGPMKGTDDLLDAIASRRDDLKDKFVMHIGGNGEVDKFMEKARALGVDDIISYEGWVGGDKKDKLMSLSSIHVLPSYAEGMPISLLEGMGYGQAPICTPVGSILEVADSTCAIIITPGDVEALADALVKLVSDSDLRQKLGEAAKSKVGPHLPESVSRRLTELYNNILININESE